MLPIIIQQTDLKRGNIDPFPSLAKCREIVFRQFHPNQVDNVLMDILIKNYLLELHFYILS